jgi:aspartyl-tRNA(Asn)/glutamyl-tRNA(Gln) amidotransferase subunit C
MQIDDEVIGKLAHLARLEFNDESKEDIKKDLNRILTFVEKLNELDTENVEPLVYMTEEFNVLREDEVEISVTRQEALKNAPQKDSDYFKVPTVMERK